MFATLPIVAVPARSPTFHVPDCSAPTVWAEANSTRRVLAVIAPAPVSNAPPPEPPTMSGAPWEPSVPPLDVPPVPPVTGKRAARLADNAA